MSVFVLTSPAWFPQPEPAAGPSAWSSPRYGPPRAGRRTWSGPGRSETVQYKNMYV